MIEPSITDWINAAAAAIGALAIIVGLLGANSKINSARQTAKALRRSQIAEELISLSFNVEDALKSMRRALDSYTVPEDETDNKLYFYKMRFERLVSHNELFRKLRDA